MVCLIKSLYKIRECANAKLVRHDSGVTIGSTTWGGGGVE